MKRWPEICAILFRSKPGAVDDEVRKVLRDQLEAVFEILMRGHPEGRRQQMTGIVFISILVDDEVVAVDATRAADGRSAVDIDYFKGRLAAFVVADGSLSTGFL